MTFKFHKATAVKEQSVNETDAVEMTLLRSRVMYHIRLN